MRARCVAAVAASLIAAMPLPARAASYSVSVASNSFDPRAITSAEPGSTITWSWAGGTHNVTAVDGSFASGDLSIGATYSAPFTGGSLVYRCTLHSAYDAGARRCTGMCGYVTELATFDLTPPTITIESPTNGQVLVVPPVVTGTVVSHPVTIRGTATDDTVVGRVQLTVYNTNGQPTQPAIACPGCGTPSTTWSATLNLLPGHYLADALALDGTGNAGSFPRIRFVVL